MNDKTDKKPWDDNLPENKKYICKFYKKSEKDIVKNEKDEKDKK